MEDAAGFFANVFGGDRFVEYVRIRPLQLEISASNELTPPDRRNIYHERYDISGHNHDERRGEG